MNKEIKEVLSARHGLLFSEEELSPVFCKPKLIPLRSADLEKVRNMQQDSMKILKEMKEENEKNLNKQDKLNFEKSTTDIWSAEENRETTTASTKV
ncbi:unnamed protein product [Thelazia callipaeda]|uniref:BBSome-interacting protein 1 n=1 Tax=Thelazia callipaeda TaxID=103827 RepID=A0A0N5CJA8_THECL|nr:unnamed protein product [Thelazia callipaeda]